MEILGVLILLGIIFILYLASSYESNHDRHMRRIKECQEDWRKDNNGIITPKNIEKEQDSDSIKLRLWIGEGLPKDANGFPVHIKKEYEIAYISGDFNQLPSKALKKWNSGQSLIPKIKMKPRINNIEDKNKTYRGTRGGRYTKDKTKDGRPYRRYF